MEVSTSIIDLVPTEQGNFVELGADMGGDVASAIAPFLPSLLRKENVRFLNLIDTTEVPDFKVLLDFFFDHDIWTALNMIASDVVAGYELGGKDADPAVTEVLEELDGAVDLSDLYQTVALDEIRFGNAIIHNRYEKKRMVEPEIVHPGRIIDMKLSPRNKPMFWVFSQENSKPNVAYVDKKYMDKFKSSGHSSSEIVGPASEIVFFKGTSPRYQTWGVGVTQIAKLLIEAKLDMLVDFSKIIKREAQPKEIVYVNTTGLHEDQRKAKINATIAKVTAQRKLGTIMVLEMNESELKVVGSEGKVLDNFCLHYKEDLMRAIRMLTRVPPSFWLGEATNKATINSQVQVYNRFLNTLRWNANRKWKNEIFYPYLVSNNFLNETSKKKIPDILFRKVSLEDPTDRAIIDDILVRNGTKSRHQVALEWGTQLPEDAGEIPPDLSGKSKMARLTVEDALLQRIGDGHSPQN